MAHNMSINTLDVLSKRSDSTDNISDYNTEPVYSRVFYKY